jgi:hypothetical protein
MTIELNDYGFLLETNWFYIALSWQILITVAIITTAVLLYKKWNTRK